MLPRMARIIPPLLAIAAWVVAAWACYGDSTPDGDDMLAVALAVAITGWALLDLYYRLSARQREAIRAEALEHDTVVAAEGVAAFIRQQADGGKAQRPSRELARPAQ